MRWLCISLLLLAGCGGGTKDKPVRIVTISGIIEPFPMYVCSVLGHFREEGVETSIEALASGNKLVEALMGGSADVVYNSYIQTVQMGTIGKPLRSFFMSSVTPETVLVVSPAKAQRINKVEDLKGATVGISGFGTPQEQLLANVLVRHGLSVRDLKLVPYGSGPTAIAAIEHSKVDAGTINGSAFELMRRRTPGVGVLADLRTREGMTAAYGFDAYGGRCFYSTQDWISRNPEIVKKMVRAMRKTHSWLQAHTAEEVREFLPAQFHSDSKEADVATLRILMASLTRDGKMPAGGPENVLRMLSNSMESVAKVDLSTTWTNEFVEAP